MNFISYIRVSTKKQGESGLGLEAQEAVVKNYTSRGELIASFIEVESGKNNTRPQLLKALQACKEHNAVLVIAKLDRLSRNLTFISQLMDAKIKIVCCDMPEANELTLNLMAVLAQQERKWISERTKSALAALKERGVKLGSPQNLDATASAKGVAANQKKAKENPNNKRAMQMINLFSKEGMKLQQIADKLNESGFHTSTGRTFRPEQVRRLMK
jgi:DNA invertase Pin-like site-specific DNA recombinase